MAGTQLVREGRNHATSAHHTATNTLANTSTERYCLCLPPAAPAESGPAPNVSAGPAEWCRTAPPVLAACYRQPNLFMTIYARALLVSQGLPGLSGGGGYVLLAQQVLFVCEDPVTDECGTRCGAGGVAGWLGDWLDGWVG